MTRQIHAGRLAIGGGAPVSVQSMNNTKTEDVAATVAQIEALVQAGCEMVRLAVPTHAAAARLAKSAVASALPSRSLRTSILITAWRSRRSRRARTRSASTPATSARPSMCAPSRAPARRAASPSASGSTVAAWKRACWPNTAGPTPRAMLESALEHAALLRRFDFDDICLSLKSSSVRDCVACYRLAAQETDYPLHIGVTEAGAGELAVVKSAAGIGALLLDGICDTLRVSLTGDPRARGARRHRDPARHRAAPQRR